MKTNIGIETTDEEREKIAQTLSLSHKLAKREDIRDAVNNYIQELINGRDHTDIPDAGGPRRDRDDDGESGHQGLPDRDNSVAAFRPSRGDEPYLYKARDPALKELHSNLLDAIEALEEYTWNQMENNRDS